VVRKARVADAKAIGDLINHYARRGMLLPKPLGRVYETLRTFSVWEENGKVLGCGRLDIVWENLAEVGSVAVHDSLRGQGVGSRLVESLVEEARELGIPRLFALTYQVNFFKRLGFNAIPKHDLPQKIWKDCLACSKYDRCDETAVIQVLEEVPALNGTGAPTAADFGLSGFTRMPIPATAHTLAEPPASPPTPCARGNSGQKRNTSVQSSPGPGVRLQILP